MTPSHEVPRIHSTTFCPAPMYPEGAVVAMLGVQFSTRQNALRKALLGHEAGQVVKVVLNCGGRIIETEVRLAKRQ